MRNFVGRTELLARMAQEWTATRQDGEGRLLTIRGRRRVGKTWLVEELLDRLDAPNVFFAASRQTAERELGLFAQAVAASSLPRHRQAEGVTFETWQAALVNAAEGTDREHPSVIVIDELPYLLGEKSRQQEAVLGAVQAAWDRSLSKQPVLLVLVGSDQAMMEMATAPKQPLHQRPSREIFVPPLNPAEAAVLSGLSGADALDSYLVTGGFPKAVRARADQPLEDFLHDQLVDDGTALVTSGRMILDSEFGGNSQARSILSVLGEGFRKRADISRETGIDGSNIKRPLDVLVEEKRVVVARRPLSTAKSRDTRYEIVDPYLRFYMRFIDRFRGEIERGRGRGVAALIMRDWSTYRGKAVEVIIRDAVDELLPDERFGDTTAVGAYWADGDGRLGDGENRTKSVEIDLIGADRQQPPAKRLAFIGSIKWRERKTMLRSDHSALIATGSTVPGVVLSDVRTVAVSRSGFDSDATEAFDVSLGPDDILRAWPVR